MLDQRFLQKLFPPRVRHELVKWPNIAQLILLCNVISEVFGQHWLDNIPAWLIQHCIGYFPIKGVY